MAKHIAIMIDCSSEAFRDERGEIHRLLAQLAEDYLVGEVHPGHRLFDVHGRTCGEVKVLMIEGGR